MRVTSKGQITIPIEVRERLGILPNREVEFELDGNAVRIRKARGNGGTERGRSIVERLVVKRPVGSALSKSWRTPALTNANVGRQQCSTRYID